MKEAEWEKPGRHAMSIMEIVALIREEFPSLEINNLGESDSYHHQGQRKGAGENGPSG